MANQLKMAKVHSILTLHQNGWSSRRIARELGVHRDTVRRHLRLAKEPAKPAKAPPGSDASAAAKPAKAPPGSAAGAPRSRSACEPFRQIIEEKLDQGLTAQRIYQDLVGDHGFSDKYHSVRRFVRKLAASGPLPFRRMECEPGAEGQVDFGTGAPVVNGEGRRRRTHVLRVVLSHSRKGYSESAFRQTTESFLQCLENAFWHFGGVPRTVVIDNLKAAVARADWYDPEVHPIVRSFCEHYGTVLVPTRPYMPRHKGKVERGVGYVKSNALKGRTFATLADENRHLLDWETTVADTRLHGTTRKQVGKVFREVEKPALLPLPAGRFGFFREAQRSVHRDGHVEVAKAYYSVPPEYLARRVWVRWDGRVVRIFNERMEQIAFHAQRDPGRFSTQGKHIHVRKVSGVERGAEWMLEQVARIGPQTDRWARAMVEARGVQGVRVLAGLRSLAGHYRDSQIERACEIALSHTAFRLRTLRALLKRDGDLQESFEFLAEHEIIRDMAEYGQLVQASFRQEPLIVQT